MPSLVITRNASGQNLVESTKLERIVIDSKTASRKEKEEKKERRKRKKEKREKSHKHSSKKDHVGKKQLLASKKTSSDSDKSDLTEELDGPQNHLGYLSDGSQNSKKRKRDASPPAVESLIKAAPVAGKPLRIRLIFKKPKVDSPSLPQEDVVACSTPVAVSLNHRAAQAVVCSKVCEPELNVPSTSEAAIDETKKICVPELNVPSTSEAAIVEAKKICEPELNVPSTSEAALEVTKKRKKHKPSREDQYNALFDHWNPPSSIYIPAMEVDDDDWLFGSRAQERLNCKAAGKIDEDVNMSLHGSSDSSWPKAQFLSQVGIYSLPYTVPF